VWVGFECKGTIQGCLMLRQREPMSMCSLPPGTSCDLCLATAEVPPESSDTLPSILLRQRCTRIHSSQTRPGKPGHDSARAKLFEQTGQRKRRVA
jgi:hypothetical protein